jgi:hypothetical protein
VTPPDPEETLALAEAILAAHARRIGAIVKTSCIQRQFRAVSTVIPHTVTTDQNVLFCAAAMRTPGHMSGVPNERCAPYLSSRVGYAP